MNVARLCYYHLRKSGQVSLTQPYLTPKSQPTTGVAEEDLGPLIPVAVGALGGDLVFLRGPHQERHELVLRRQRALLSDARSLAAPRIDRFQVRVSYSYLEKVSEKYEPPTTLHGIMDEE